MDGSTMECWKDMWVLWAAEPARRPTIESAVKEQFAADQESDRPSVLAKWLPREGSAYDQLASNLANILFPLTPTLQRMRQYRKTVSYLSRRAQV